MAEVRASGANRSTPNLLDDLKVIDLTSMIAGPVCGRMFAELGANVIHVEPPWGDDGRNSTTPFLGREGVIYSVSNRSKRGICLDLTMPEGIATLKRLVAVSDVVAESYRFGVLERLGAGYEALRAVKPDIVYVSFSSQGSVGPEREYGSYGAILEQTAGIASITGYRGGPPTSSGTFFPDPVVAMLGVGVVS